MLDQLTEALKKSRQEGEGQAFDYLRRLGKKGGKVVQFLLSGGGRKKRRGEERSGADAAFCAPRPPLRGRGEREKEKKEMGVVTNSKASRCARTGGRGRGEKRRRGEGDRNVGGAGTLGRRKGTGKKKGKGRA